MVGRNIIANLQESLGLNGILQSLGGGEFLNVGPAQDLHRSASSSEAGATTMLSLMRKCSGWGISTSAPRVLGSVNTPVKAETAAVSGLTR